METNKFLITHTCFDCWTYSYTFFLLSGRDVFYEHVKKYELEFSTDGVSWQPYQEGGAKKVNLFLLLVRELGGESPGE